MCKFSIDHKSVVIHATLLKLFQNYLLVVRIYQHNPSCTAINHCEIINHFLNQNHPYPQITVNRNILFEASNGVICYKISVRLSPIFAKCLTWSMNQYLWVRQIQDGGRWMAAILDFQVFFRIRHRITHIYRV